VKLDLFTEYLKDHAVEDAILNSTALLSDVQCHLMTHVLLEVSRLEEDAVLYVKENWFATELLIALTLTALQTPRE